MRRDASGRSRTPGASKPDDGRLDVEIEALDVAGDGLAHAGGTRLFVPYSIPGERLRVRVVRRRGRDAWAAIDAILRPSRHRVAARCTHFGPADACGGCTWQHIAYAEQLRLKRELVRRLVSSAVDRTPAVGDTLPSTPIDGPWGYRQKAHFVFGAERDGGLAMGHYARGSRRVFMARECPVHDARANAFAFAFHRECARAGVSAAASADGRPSGPGTLRHLAVRVAAATSERMATLVVTHGRDARLRDATRRVLAGEEAPGSFHLNLHERPDPYIFGRETRRLAGPRHLREAVAGAAFLVSPTAFFQTNVYAAELLVQLVLESLPPGRPVLDLYAGVGLFAIPLARRGDAVTAIEENRLAADDGMASVKLNDIPAGRCRFVARPVEAALAAVRPHAARHVVLDPPRSGCSRAALDEVFGRLRPERAAYVSCSPEALATDLRRIVRHGYTIERLQPVDMFPHTAHVETVAVLAR